MNPSVKKLGKFNTKLPKKGAFTIETEPEFPKLHTLCIASGKRGGGKSIAIANFIKSCKDKHYYDRVFLITPTYYSNKQIWDIADIQEEDTYEPTVTVLREITGVVEAERAERRSRGFWCAADTRLPTVSLRCPNLIAAVPAPTCVLPPSNIGAE